jgi:sec-independent protein translocase protein TatA
LIVVVLVVLLLFGGSRLGELGKGLGDGIRNFKKGIGGDDDASKDGDPDQLEAKDREAKDDAAKKK